MPTPIQADSSKPFLPERLNLAIGKRCFVSCPGCYTHFGRHEPDLKQLLASISRFVDLGLHDITISGGDPLTINQLLFFLDDLRDLGVRSIKLDTVGTHLLENPMRRETIAGLEDRPTLDSLLQRLDFVGIPLDGWSNTTVSLFRAGRPHLYTETVELLDAIDVAAGSPMVIINTVAHALNLSGLCRIGQEILRHPAVCYWNVFQFSPTDQVSEEVIGGYRITDQMFYAAEKDWCSLTSDRTTAKGVTTEFRSIRSRLGQYLLINSDGVAWVPDECGQTILLGTVFKNETQILANWAKTVSRFRRAPTACGDQ